MIGRKWITALATGMAILWGSSVVAGAADTHRKGLTDVVRDLEIEVAAISEHAAKLDQMAEWPNRYTMTSHEFEWTGIQARFDDIDALVPKLTKAAAGSPGWQKEAVTEMTSLVKAMKVQAESGLEALNETTSVERLFANQLYELRIESISHYAEHVDRLIEYVEMHYPPMS